jgi:hypothetical protein
MKKGKISEKRKVKDGSRCRNVILIDIRTYTHVRVPTTCEKGRKAISEVDWKKQTQKIFAIGMRREKKWKAELTRQVSYSVHWSPSHTFPSTAYQSCVCGKIFSSYYSLLLFFILAIIDEWEKKKLISFQFRCLQIGQISLLYSIYLETALIHFAIYDDDVAVVG